MCALFVQYEEDYDDDPVYIPCTDLYRTELPQNTFNDGKTPIGKICVTLYLFGGGGVHCKEGGGVHECDAERLLMKLFLYYPPPLKISLSSVADFVLVWEEKLQSKKHKMKTPAQAEREQQRRARRREANENHRRRFHRNLLKAGLLLEKVRALPGVPPPHTRQTFVPDP